MRLLSVMLLALAGCSTSSSSGGDCAPPPASCDAPAPEMRPVDSARGCLLAPVTLGQVCSTSVNRCYASMGLGGVCAFAPDGRVYFAIGSDNFVLTADKWRFSQVNGGAAWQPPASQGASVDDATVCAHASCMPPCPGAPKVEYGGLCALDAGAGDAARD